MTNKKLMILSMMVPPIIIYQLLIEKILVQIYPSNFLFNIIPQQSYTLYLGAGPNLTFGASYAEFTSKDEDQAEIRISSSTSTSYGIGIIALIGTEANLTNNISLFAESHFTLSKSWSSSDNTSNSYLSSSSKNTVWSANIHIVKVGLGIYF